MRVRSRRNAGGPLVGPLVAAVLVLASCGAGTTTAIPGAGADRPTTLPGPALLEGATSERDPVDDGEGPPPTAVGDAAPAVVVPATTTTQPRPASAAGSGSSATTTTTTTTSTTTTTTVSAPPSTAPPSTTDGAAQPSTPADPAGANAEWAAAAAAFEGLARSNAAASMSIRRDGRLVLARATGTTIGGAPATSDSPMLVASVSKVVTAVAVAHLAQLGFLDVGGPVPWSLIGIDPDPAWGPVTVRELLDHTSGMPVARSSWFTGGGDCASFLPSLVAAPPQSHRGRWTYSNGNYCALGLLVQATAGAPLDAAIQGLVFDPLGLTGTHLTTSGLVPTDVDHPGDETRLSRLGGAGSYVVSTDDLTAVLSAITPADRETLRSPGIMIDEYGWGHTGTIDGAKSCVWVIEDGRTTVAATVAGNVPSTGGGICDRIVPAAALDLGIGTGRLPDRFPP